MFKNNKKKTILNTIDKLTTQKNQIISASLITELSKASKLVNNNKKTEKDVSDWKNRFEKIEKNDIPKITDKLLDVETLCINEDYATAYTHLTEVEKDIFRAKAKSVKLLSELSKSLEKTKPMYNKDGITETLKQRAEISKAYGELLKVNTSTSGLSKMNEEIGAVLKNIK